jgi:CHASE2 domain-containing sensor protein
MDNTASYRLTALLVVVLLALPLAFAAQGARAFGPETRMSDAWFRTRPKRAPRNDMILVARDSKTLDAMGKPSHADYAAVVRKLSAAGARLIVLDLDLDDRQGRPADRALWTAIADARATAVMVRYAQARQEIPDPDELRGLRALERSAHWQEFSIKPGTPEWGWLNFAPATSDFIHSATGAGVAVTEQSLDPDQVLRRSRAAYLTKVLYPSDTRQGSLTNFVAVVPNLAVISAVLAQGRDARGLEYRFGQRLSFDGRAAQAMDRNGFVSVDYAGPAGTFPRVSMVDVLRSQPHPDRFKNRIVLVGGTVPGDALSEERLTPYGSRMPRVEITANVVQSLLNGRSLTESHVVGLWTVLAFGMLLGLVVPAFRTGPSVIAALGSLLGYLLIGWALFWTRSIMLPLAPALLLTVIATIACALLALWMRPFAVARYVETHDTGMALGPNEPLPDTPPARTPTRHPWFRQRGV